jgi:3',5'-nucleoside bisphosphate phosphatase
MMLPPGYRAENFLRIDLHSHSTFSDGVLSPASLVRRAAGNGVSMLALTDHDEIGGLRPAAAAAVEAGLILIPGVEISATWAGYTVHVLGLGIDPGNLQLAEGLTGQAAARVRRARRISERLSIVGIADAYSGAASHATESGVPGRAHFARHIAERGFARDMKAAFSRYLAHGKPGFVAPEWAPLEQVLAWIHAAGGRAILAHPDSYRFSPLQLHALLEQFKTHGGDAIEYSAGSATALAMLSRTARFFGFALSAGSDFHAPTPGSADLGQVPPLPHGARAVWHDWDLPKMAA